MVYPGARGAAPGQHEAVELQEGSRKGVVFAVSLHFPWWGLDLVLVTRCMTQCNFLSLLKLSFFSFITSSRIVLSASKDRVS